VTGNPFLDLVALPIAFGLFGFIEPCSIGSTLIFVKAMEGKPAPVKLAQVSLFAGFRAPRRCPFPRSSCATPRSIRARASSSGRGPTWAFINWFLYHALKKRGFHERAHRLRRSLGSFSSKAGFATTTTPSRAKGTARASSLGPGC
jgi:hypothetical protein